MKYCMKCGVSVNEDKNRLCPLCDTIILKDEEIDQLSIQEIKTEEKVYKEKKETLVRIEKRNIMGFVSFLLIIFTFVSILTLFIVDLAVSGGFTWSIIPIMSIILFFLLVGIPFMTLNRTLYWYITFDAIVLLFYFTLLNLIINHRITWSFYVCLSVILAWVYLSTLLVNKIKGFILKMSVNFVASTIFVLFVSLGLTNNSIFSKLIIPINGLLFILTVISYLTIKTFIYNWHKIISRMSINISILCIGIDLLIERYVNNRLALKWSYIVLFVLVPVTLFMIYLDHRYKIHKYLAKKFHI